MSHIENKDLPKIAIIGRPNVGKSSIFNRMLRYRKAIIESVPGVTRDRLYATLELRGENFILIDTGGITSKPKDNIAALVYEQSKQAIDESDAIIFACDVSSGLTYQDEQVALLLKRNNKKTFLAVNKVDNTMLENEIFDFYKLGLGKPYSISAMHRRGFDELYKDIIDYISNIKKSKSHKYSPPLQKIAIAVVGRPNVGKSSFINCILNQRRLLVDNIPGTTRDSVDVYIKRDKEIIMFIDTAGMRHKKKIKDTVEIFSLARAKQSVRRCDIAIVMVDGTASLCRDDIAVIDYVIKQGKCCVIAVNKCDLIKDLNVNNYKKALLMRYKPLEWIPIMFTSCKQRENIIKAVDTACEIVRKSKLSMPTPRLNGLLEKLQRINPHPFYKSIRPKIYYATQAGVSPVVFLLFVTNPSQIRLEYLRFIERNVRKEFNFFGVPISFQLRRKK